MQKLFGTDGIRGLTATAPTLSPPFLHQLGKALTKWLLHKGITHPRILFARDTRKSSRFIMDALCCGFSGTTTTIIDAGVCTTPMAHYLVSRFPGDYHCGIIITASHNGPEYNGIKLVGQSGKISQEDEALIELFIDHTPQATYCTFAPAYHPLPTHHATSYLHHISRLIPSNIFANLHIVLDCANGAASHTTPALFAGTGARLTVLYANPEEVSTTTACGSEHPEVIAKAVCTNNANIGFAFDADGDRVVVATKDGAIIKGEMLLAFLSTHPLFASQTTLVSTQAANSGFAQWLAQQGKTLICTDVGDRAVGAAMKECGALLGGEPSGHVIISPYSITSDGLVAALLTTHTLHATGNTTMQTFTPVPQVSITVPVQFRESLTQEPFISILTRHKEAIAPGRLLVRYSGTEPCLRIMAEHQSEHTARQIAHSLARELEPLLTITHSSEVPDDLCTL
jgi:phosphoglucosamine mutase